MLWPLTSSQQEAVRHFRAFVDEAIAPHAARFEQQQSVPADLLVELGRRGYLGVAISARHGGQPVDAVTLGLLCEQIGRASASVLSLLTVHTMVGVAIERWGNDAQRRRWLPQLARGEALAAFCLSEPEVGSDAEHVETLATRHPQGFALSGRKRWISGAQSADLFLVVASLEGKLAAFLVERARPGLEVAPIRDMYGFRAANLGEVVLTGCVVGEDAQLGRPGFGFSHVAGAALDHGRFCIASGAVGLATAAVETALAHARTRHQFGRPIGEHQLVQRMLSKMITETNAARALAGVAAYARRQNSPDAVVTTSMAKYFAARTAVRAALDTIQVLGARGCSEAYPAARYLRDAKVLEIIEGSQQMQEVMLARAAEQLVFYDDPIAQEL